MQIARALLHGNHIKSYSTNTKAPGLSNQDGEEEVNKKRSISTEYNPMTPFRTPTTSAMCWFVSRIRNKTGQREIKGKNWQQVWNRRDDTVYLPMQYCLKGLLLLPPRHHFLVVLHPRGLCEEGTPLRVCVSQNVVKRLDVIHSNRKQSAVKTDCEIEQASPRGLPTRRQ